MPGSVVSNTLFPSQAFHARYYHPSNARFWFYGDDAPEERLRLLAAYLDEFEARPVDSAVHTQPLFTVRGGLVSLWAIFFNFVCGQLAPLPCRAVL